MKHVLLFLAHIPSLPKGDVVYNFDMVLEMIHVVENSIDP
jgi:hypothetical protein